MLRGASLVGFIPVTDLSQARSFYVDTLGLALLEDTPIALVVDANGTSVRLALVDGLRPQPFTVAGWLVADIAGVVDALSAAGVAFQRFEGMDQDDRGIWTTPGGGRVAWFRDPDGNTLSVTEEAT
jgi:catechol 2,3-dioxygenase-like lactoylglutathione lyase family enzyme